MAVEHFEKAITSDPNHVEANFQFGEILATARKFSEAGDCLRRAIDNDPGFNLVMSTQQLKP